MKIAFASDFRNDDEVAAKAEALHRNMYAGDFEFDFGVDEREDGDRPPALNWDPLLREIESRQHLHAAAIIGEPEGHLVAVFHQLFQALQRNQNATVVSLSLAYITFSTNINADAIVSFLDNAPSLLNLWIVQCGRSSGSSVAESNIAAALQRNNRIRRLKLFWCGPSIVCPIFQSLVSSDSKSILIELEYKATGYTEDIESTEGALQQYLESPSATIRRLELSEIAFNEQSRSSIILRGLYRNTSVKEFVFHDCRIGEADWPHGDDEENEEDEAEQESPRQLAYLLRSKPDLKTLHFPGCNFLEYRKIADAVADLLTRRGSTLLDMEMDCLLYEPDFGWDRDVIPIAQFRVVMAAIASSTRLEHLLIKNINLNDEDHFQTLEENIRRFKVEDLTLQFEEESQGHEEERVLAALKRNYMAQSIQCLLSGEGGFHWLSAAHQSRLEFFVNRNQELAQWIVNPKLVPCDLWPKAMMLALKAGMGSLYQSLLALSGEGVGLRQRGRKRKRPQLFKP